MTRPHISLRKLPGEQNDTYRTGFQPMTDPLCCMQTRLFSHSTLVLYIYNIEKDRMQEENRIDPFGGNLLDIDERREIW